MTVSLANVRFRAFQADEDATDTSHGPGWPGVGSVGGGGGGGTPTTISVWSDGLGIVWNNLGGGRLPYWESFWDGTNHTNTVADAWHHIVYVTTLHDSAGIIVLDDSLTVDGTLLFSSTGTSTGAPVSSEWPNAVVFGADSTPTNAALAYLDDISIDGSLVDDFEAGSLAAWDTVTGGATISTDHAHGGTNSLKSDPDVDGNGFVGKLVTVTDGVPVTLDLWVFLPSASFYGADPGSNHYVGDLFAIVQIP